MYLETVNQGVMCVFRPVKLSCTLRAAARIIDITATHGYWELVAARGGKLVMRSKRLALCANELCSEFVPSPTM